MKKEYLIVLFAVFAAFTATAAFFYPSLSTDAWWHISSGREIIKAKAIPAHDDFYCNGTNKWYAHEWLFDAGIYSLYAKGGERGVKSFFGALFFAILILIFYTSLRAARGSLAGAVTASLLACALLIPYSEERPQIITVFSMALFVLAGSVKPSKKSIAYFYLLVPLTVLWTNVHSAAITGVYVFAVSYACHYLSAEKNEKGFILTHGAVLLPLLLASTLASPLGLKAVMFFGEDAWLKQYITEWQGIIAKAGIGYTIYTCALIIAGASGAVLALLKFRDKGTAPEALRDILVIAPFFAAAFITKKILPVFIVALVPVIAAGVSQKANKVFRIILPMACLILTGLFLVDREVVAYPKTAMDIIKNSGKPGCVFTSFEWGGYAENELYPGNKVFLNGRLNAPEFTIRMYSNIYDAKGDFLEFMKETNVEYYVLSHSSPLAYYLFNKAAKPVYEDGACVVYYRPQDSLFK